MNAKAPKTCQQCGAEFSPKRKMSQGTWARRQFCGRRCADNAKIVSPEERAAKAPERFWAKVKPSGDCWVWTAMLDPAGYGRFGFFGTPLLAHRFAYESLRAEIPDGLHIDHLCRNRACVNPWHLEPVSQAENNRRSSRWAR